MGSGPGSGCCENGSSIKSRFSIANNTWAYMFRFFLNFGMEKQNQHYYTIYDKLLLLTEILICNFGRNISNKIDMTKHLEDKELPGGSQSFFIHIAILCFSIKIK